MSQEGSQQRVNQGCSLLFHLIESPSLGTVIHLLVFLASLFFAHRSSDSGLRQLLVDFIFIDSRDKKKYLKEHPDLLTNNALAELDQLIEYARVKNDNLTLRTYIQHRELLSECLSKGVEATFDNYLRPSNSFNLTEEINLLSQPRDMSHRIELYYRTLEEVDYSTQSEIWAALQLVLGNSLYTNPLGNRTNNLEQAIVHLKQSFLFYTKVDFPEQWAIVHENLGEVYQMRIGGNKADNIELAIFHYREALQVRTQTDFPEQWADTQLNLGNAYAQRIKGNRADNLEQAIHCYQQVLEIPNYQYQGLIHKNLSEAYRRRIKGDRADNYERAIFHSQQALKTYTKTGFPTEWADIQNNLGNSYLGRTKGNDGANLEEGISHLKQALEVYTKVAFPRKWAETQRNLGNAYFFTYMSPIKAAETTNDPNATTPFTYTASKPLPANPDNSDNITSPIYIQVRDNFNLAVHHYHQALEVYTKVDFPIDWAATQNDLGLIYKQGDDLERAFFHFQQASQVSTKIPFPRQWATIQANLGDIYSSRIPGERIENLKQAVHHYQQALQVKTLEQFPLDYCLIINRLGNLHFNERQWQQADRYYQQAIKAGEMLLGMAYTEIGRLAEVRIISGVYFYAAYTLLQLGKLEEALERLEQGKTRLLAEALALNDVDLVHLSEIHQSQMRRARQRVHQLQALMRLSDDEPIEDSNYDFAEALRQARANLSQLIQIIREDHPGFMRTSLTLTEILALIPTGGALVIPLITSQGSAVFVLPHDIRTIEAKNIIWLDNFTDNEVYSLLNGDNENLGWFNGYIDTNKMIGSKSRKVALETWQTIIENSTRKLWDVLMGPIQQRLTDFGLAVAAPVTLIPPGVLGLLPLHAAWRNINDTRVRRAFLDDYTVSYAPSVYALSVSHRRVTVTKRQPATLLAIVNPTANLPYVATEGESVAAFFNPANHQILVEDQATQTAILRHTPGKAYFHFAGHGFFDFLTPMESSLHLAGGDRLTMAEIVSHLDLSAVRLVVLSACETGQTESRQTPDEFIGLPASFLQAGAPGVISTLWKVNDRSTTLLIWRFYWYHLVEGLPPAAALRQAQIWLRGMTLAELEQNISSLRESNPFLYIELEEIRQGLLKKYGNNAATRPFAHLYFWAAFTFTGL